MDPALNIINYDVPHFKTIAQYIFVQYSTIQYSIVQYSFIGTKMHDDGCL